MYGQTDYTTSGFVTKQKNRAVCAASVTFPLLYSSHQNKNTSEIGARTECKGEIVNYANVRHAPGLNSTVCGKLYNGTEVWTTGEKVTKDGYTWYKIVLPEGSDEAWIAGSLIGY